MSVAVNEISVMEISLQIQTIFLFWMMVEIKFIGLIWISFSQVFREIVLVFFLTFTFLIIPGEGVRLDWVSLCRSTIYLAMMKINQGKFIFDSYLCYKLSHIIMYIWIGLYWYSFDEHRNNFAWSQESFLIYWPRGD